MARLARIVVPGLPHRITQRGNRRAPAFFDDGDYALSRLPPSRRQALLAEAAGRVIDF